jgi:hypothetical protein
MSMNAVTLVIANSGAVVGWTITAVLTFLLIGVPVLYLFVLTLADDDDAFDRRVRDIELYVEFRNRAQGYARSKNDYNDLEKTTSQARVVAASGRKYRRQLAPSRSGVESREVRT